MTDLHLVFMHGVVRYAIDAARVQAIIWLPELSPVADASPMVIGAFNLRGHVVPVLDLSLCLGHRCSPLRVGDAVIVLEVDGERFGMVVADVLDAAPIPQSEIEDVDSHHELLGSSAHLLRGVALRGEELAMVLDPRALLARAAANGGSSEAARECGGRLPDDQIEVLRARARGMAQLPEAPHGDVAEQVLQIRLDTETLGMPVRVVREIMHLRDVWPMPCCPPHILGSMNVRGDILTLVDLRPMLGLPDHRPLAEVVVVRSGDLTVGVAVGEVLEIAGAVRLARLPADGRELPFCQEAARSGDRFFSVIDIEALLASRVLHVNDEPGRHKPEVRGADFPRGRDEPRIQA